MTIIDRYLGKTVVGATLLVLFVFISLGVMISLITQLGDIGKGGYGLGAAIEYVFLSLPQQIYLLFPLACLVGIMLGLSTLANHSELTVMRVSGLPINSIALSVIKASAILLLIATLFGEWVAPLAENAASDRKASLTSNGQAFTTRQGTWIRDGANFIYIRFIFNNNYLEGITRYQLDNHYKLMEVSFAKSAVYQHHQWVMQQVVTSKISAQQVTTESYPVAYWKLSISPQLLRIAAVDPNTMTLPQLYKYIHYLKKNNLDATEVRLIFWQRIFKPLATIVMMLLAIPFVFGSLRTVSIGLRLVIGIMIGFLFSITNQFFGPLTVVYQLPPLLAAVIPTFLFSIVAFWLLKRVS